jgi:transcriptional regulator with XRE-family HTH domain
VDDESPLGEFIRRQRELQALTMRQLAELAGISSPYLSQIEHGLREPSERVLEALADNLELSADVLRERTRRAQDEDEDEPPVVMAIKADRNLSARQRQTLIEIYESFTGRAGRSARAGDA